MKKEDKIQYSKLIMSMSLDFQMENISWEHYINTLELCIYNMKMKTLDLNLRKIK